MSNPFYSRNTRQIPRLGRAGRPKEWDPAAYEAIPGLTPCVCTHLKHGHDNSGPDLGIRVHACVTCQCPNFEASYDPERILVVAGSYQQFVQYMEVRHSERMVRGSGNSVKVGHTTYRFIGQPEQVRGIERATPVILTGTWWHYDWIWEIKDRFTKVDEDPY